MPRSCRYSKHAMIPMCPSALQTENWGRLDSANNCCRGSHSMDRRHRQFLGVEKVLQETINHYKYFISVRVVDELWWVRTKKCVVVDSNTAWQAGPLSSLHSCCAKINGKCFEAACQQQRRGTQKISIVHSH